MCTEIAILNTDGSADYVSIKSEIEQRLGGPVPGMDGLPEDCCLCPLDEVATAKLYGYSLSAGWDSHGADWVMAPTPPIAQAEQPHAPSAVAATNSGGTT